MGLYVEAINKKSGMRNKQKIKLNCRHKPIHQSLH